MHFQNLIVPTVALISSTVATPTPRGKTLLNRQSSGKFTSAQDRANAVKEAFVFAWNGYEKYASKGDGTFHDELKPVSNSFHDTRNGWGASSVDAFTTAIVMQETDIVNTILESIPKIDFDTTDQVVSLFETTIRYIGGMLGGHDLLTGPLADLTSNSDALDKVLAQAKHLADNMAFAFDTPTGIPSNNLFFNNQSTDGSTTNGLATIGSLVLEWTHLSDLLNDDHYANLTSKGESYLLNPQPANSEPWEGLVGSTVDINTGKFTDALGGWNGGDDSFYEYLLKMYVYDSDRFSKYRDRWIAAADSSIEHLASHPSTNSSITFLAEFDGQDRIFQSGHLACFDGGNFLLGGLVLNEQKYKDFGLALVDGCHQTYTSTTTGIGPEGFQWTETDSDPQPSTQAEADFYAEHGFWITSSGYILRPEVMESYYYAYRITKDQKYRDWAWDAFVAINATCRVGSGFSEISDVNAANGGTALDFQDSFFFAEVMKYSYLIHTDDADWQVNDDGTNKYVFNTEAHPFKVQGTAVPAPSSASY